MNRISGLIVLAAAAATLGACSDEILLRNAQPRVTWVSSELEAENDVARLTIWVADIEGDPVDLSLSLSTGQAFTLADGSYPLQGRATRAYVNDPNGAPQEILWALDDVSGSVTLTITVDDDEHDEGNSVKDQYMVTLDPFVDNAPIAATLAQPR